MNNVNIIDHTNNAEIFDERNVMLMENSLAGTNIIHTGNYVCSFICSKAKYKQCSSLLNWILVLTCHSAILIVHT